MNEDKKVDTTLKIFAKNSIIILISIILSKIFTYLYRIIIARNLGQEIYGIFSLTLMIFGVFTVFFSLGLQNGILRYISYYRGRNEEEKIKYLFQTALKIIFPLCLIAAFLLFFSADLIAVNLFHSEELAIFLKWISFFIPFSLIGGIFHATLQAYEKIKSYSFISNILVTFIQLISLITLLFFGIKNNAIIISYNLGVFSILTASFFVCRTTLPNLFTKFSLPSAVKKNLLKELFSYSWPIIFLGLVVSVFSWVDTFFIGYYINTANVGIYNAAIPISYLLLIVPTLFLQIFFPLITKEYSKKNLNLIEETSKQIGKWIFVLNLPIFILFVLFPGAIINILFGPEYLSAATSLRFLSIGLFVYSVFLVSDNLLSVAGKSKTTLFNFIIATIVNSILNILLIPKFGINGAAFATMIGYLIWSFLSLFFAKKYLNIIPLRVKMFKIFFISLLPVLIILIIRQFIPITSLFAILLGLFFFFSFLLLVFTTECLDKYDLMILNTIKLKIFRKE